MKLRPGCKLAKAIDDFAFAAHVCDGAVPARAHLLEVIQTIIRDTLYALIPLEEQAKRKQAAYNANEIMGVLSDE